MLYYRQTFPFEKRNAPEKTKKYVDGTIDKKDYRGHYSKDIEYSPIIHPLTHQSSRMPFMVNRYIRDPLRSNNPATKQRSFAAGMQDTPDFPYWNLLRQKWLLSAQPRRLSQVRLFHDLGKRNGLNTPNEKRQSTSKKFREKRSFAYRPNIWKHIVEIPQIAIPPNEMPLDTKKRSFFYLFNLIKRDKNVDSHGNKSIGLNPSLPYPKCYLNNVSCWRLFNLFNTIDTI